MANYTGYKDLYLSNGTSSGGAYEGSEIKIKIGGTNGKNANGAIIGIGLDGEFPEIPDPVSSIELTGKHKRLYFVMQDASGAGDYSKFVWEIYDKDFNILESDPNEYTIDSSDKNKLTVIFSQKSGAVYSDYEAKNILPNVKQVQNLAYLTWDANTDNQCNAEVNTGLAVNEMASMAGTCVVIINIDEDKVSAFYYLGKDF